MKLATLKFGKLDEPALARINAATKAEVELWAERILTAASLEEVFG